MKKNWKLIIGLLFLAGGFGNITSDIGAATFGLIVATILIFWWVDGRKKQQGYKETLAQRQQEEQESPCGVRVDTIFSYCSCFSGICVANFSKYLAKSPSKERYDSV